jgi:enoyl-CoA hydratase/carnithine racemase
MSDPILTDRRDGVLRITMNRPDKKNALTGPMYDAMTSALTEVDRDDTIRAVLLEGAGGAFTAGNDLGDFLAVAQGKGQSRAGHFIQAVAMLETPIVAAVDGVAVGVGTTILFHCDLVFATAAAKFRMPFVDLGLVPEAASSMLVPMRVGMAKASELILLAEAFGGEEAARLGIVNRVVPPTELGQVAFDAARKLAAKPPGAIRASRRLLRGDRAAIAAAMQAENVAFAAALQSPDARAAFETFLAKA